MRLYIKNMACIRCKMVVKSEMEKLGFHSIIHEGEVEIMEELSAEKLNLLKNSFHEIGLEIIDDRDSILIEKVKNAITELVYRTDDHGKMNISNYLSNELGYGYNYLSNLFSAVQGTSIEKYFIRTKIERVKELLVYMKLSLSEIAFQVHYSSVAHLSSQFKKETGLTPTHFRKLHQKKVKKDADQ